MKATFRQLLLFVLVSAPGTAAAQAAYSLQHSIPAPPVTGAESGASFGQSVAVDGGITAVGAPGADAGGTDAGVVKVFDSTTGALLFTLTNPAPAAGGSFGVSVAISGTRLVAGKTSSPGSAFVYDLSSATPTVPIATLNNPRPAAGDIYGRSVAISGTRVVVGDPYEDTGASNSGGAYVYDLSSATPAAPVATLHNPGPEAVDNFGWSVAISGTRVVVGAQNDNTRATHAGSAYVYDLSSATPTVPVRTLNNPALTPMNGFFGRSLAISGLRVVVAASSSTYVYDLTSATPTVPEATLSGGSVAISGPRVAVVGSSSTYVYDLSSATPTVPVATLFAGSVAISGTRVVVGGGEIAYLYELTGATPSVPSATLTNVVVFAGDGFGNAVAISGTRVVVGAAGDDTGTPDAGSAYVYDLGSGTPTVPVATFHNPGPVSYHFGDPVADSFGASVAISGTRVVIGAPAQEYEYSDAGSAYVYDLSSATPAVPVLALDNPGLSTSPHSHLFGASVAIDGTRVVVGVPSDDTGAPAAGRAYVYDLGSATPTVPVVAMDDPSAAEYDRFGNSVAISGTRVVVGANESNFGAPDSGRAYVYDLGDATPAEPVLTLNNPGPATGDRFGHSVAISGTRVVVGTSADDTGETDAGSAYVYDLSSATPKVPVATLADPDPAVGDSFGNSVAISGTRVVVGASGDDTGAGDAGSVYLYELSSGTPTVPVATLNNPGPAAGDGFGGSVAIDGTTVAIGTPNDDTVALDKGYAYIYGSNPNDTDGDGLLDGWEIARFGTTAGHGALDDTDGDGRNELLELAFDTNPLLPDAAAAPAVVNEGGFLTLTIAKHPGVNYEVQSAGTLLPALPDSFSPATTTVLIDNLTTLKACDTVPMGTAPARFLRTKVTAAP